MRLYGLKLIFRKKLLQLKKQDCLTESKYWQVGPSELTPTALYGLFKIHKITLQPKHDHLTLPKDAEEKIPLRHFNSCIG